MLLGLQSLLGPYPSLLLLLLLLLLLVLLRLLVLHMRLAAGGTLQRALGSGKCPSNRQHSLLQGGAVRVQVLRLRLLLGCGQSRQGC
jgi:hypothetical protein